MSPVFLNLSEVLHIHRDQIERYGGQAGIRDLGLLQSAVSMPAAGFGDRFLHEDLFEMAAAYLFHITRNHPFIDGNKRTGVVCALVFLELNGIGVKASEDSLVEMVMAVAEGKVGKEAIAGFFRRHAHE
jgi:death-on-curing protein